MNSGSESIVDALGCRPTVLADVGAMQRVCAAIVADLGLQVIGRPLWHQFPEPGGVTGMYLLSESHLTCHTFPEHGLATFNLYCCRPHDDWPWQTRLPALLGASSVEVRRLVRGAALQLLVESSAAAQSLMPSASLVRGASSLPEERSEAH